MSTPQPPANAAPPVSWKVFGDIVVVRFNVAPSAETARVIIEVTTRAQGGGQKISFVGIVPDRLQVPTPEFRKVLSEQAETIKRGARSVHFAIEGTGVFASLQRAMLSAIASMVSGEVPFSIHRSGEDALREIGRLRNDSTEAVIAEALQLGLIRASLG